MALSFLFLAARRSASISASCAAATSAAAYLPASGEDSTCCTAVRADSRVSFCTGCELHAARANATAAATAKGDFLMFMIFDSCSGCSCGRRSGRIAVCFMAKVIHAFLCVAGRRLLRSGLGLGGGELRVNLGLLGQGQGLVVTLGGLLLQGDLRLGVLVLGSLEFRQ